MNGGAVYSTQSIPHCSRAQRAKRERAVGPERIVWRHAAEEMTSQMSFLATRRAGRQAEMLAAEKAALGFYITGHPLERYLEILAEVSRRPSRPNLPNLEQWHRVTFGGNHQRLATAHHEEGRQVCTASFGG